jgi:hypothetical protein
VGGGGGAASAASASSASNESLLRSLRCLDMVVELCGTIGSTGLGFLQLRAPATAAAVQCQALLMVTCPTAVPGPHRNAFTSWRLVVLRIVRRTGCNSQLNWLTNLTDLNGKVATSFHVLVACLAQLLTRLF